jgi:hypothetical protein
MGEREVDAIFTAAEFFCIDFRKSMPLSVTLLLGTRQIIQQIVAVFFCL